jgi:hypothetical protein
MNTHRFPPSDTSVARSIGNTLYLKRAVQIYRGTTIARYSLKQTRVIEVGQPTHYLIYRGTTIERPSIPSPPYREPLAINWRFRVSPRD